MNKVIATVKKNMKQYTMMLALVVIVLMFQTLTGGKLLFPMNVYNIINQNAYIVILAIGMLLCIIGSGSIDLSVGSVVGLVGACAGTFIMKWKWDPYLSIFLCMCVGLLLGAWQGFWIAYVKIPAFIVTLSGMLVFRGATLIILQGGKAIPVFPVEFYQFFKGTTPEFIGVWEVAGMSIYLTCLLLGILIAAVYCVMQVISNRNKKRKGYEYATPGALIARLVIISTILIWFFGLLARYKGIPAVLLVLGLIAAIYTFITTKTVLGRHIYAMGGNTKAARLSGVKTERLMFFSYLNMGLLAGIAGMVYAARLDSATPMAGDGFELDAIGACFIGGASAYGGIGAVSGSVIGALIMGILNNGMNILGMDANMQKLVKGLVLLAAVAFDVISRNQGGRGILQYYTAVLKKYAVFYGRARRKEFWMFYLVNSIISIVVGFFATHGLVLLIIALAYAVALILPSVGVAVRRLHDTGRSGLLLLLSLIPVVGTVILIIFLCQDSSAGKNQYGEYPKK